MIHRRNRARGVALVLISALLTLMSFLAVGLLNFRRMAVQSGLAARMKSEASLAALSGLDYAASRLWQEWRPVYPWISANACDDWTAREAIVATPIENVTSPSYSRGDRAPASQGDFDKNGRIDAASGRLRGSSPFEHRFLLRVVSHAGLVCVNAGELGNPDDDQDGDGVLNGNDADYLEDYDYPPFNIPNGTEDWKDIRHEPNGRLVNLLDNLGAVAGLAPDPVAVYSWTLDGSSAWLNASAPFVTTDLGKRIVAARPRGGYGSIEDLRPVLGPDFDKVAPYLSTRGEIVPLQVASFSLSPPSLPARIDFNTADKVVIEAALRYLTAGGDGLPTPMGGIKIDKAFARLLPAEAGRIADALVQARPLWNWQEFLQALVDMPDLLFENDPFIDAAAWNATKDGPFRRRLKEDLIVTHMDIGFGWKLEEYRTHRRSLDVIREGTGDGVAIQGYAPTRDIRYRQQHVDTGTTFPFNTSGKMDDPDTGTINPVSCGSHATSPFSLAPHRGAHRVECRGWTSGSGKAVRAASASCATDIDLGEELLLATQLDFEQFLGWTGAWAAPPRRYHGGIMVDATAATAERTGIHSWPLFPATTFRAGSWFDNAPPRPPIFPTYQSYYTPTGVTHCGSGWLELGARQWDDATLLAARGVFPFNEDRERVTDINEYNPARSADNLNDPVCDYARDPNQDEAFTGPDDLHALCPMGPTSQEAGISSLTKLIMGWKKWRTLNPHAPFVSTPFARGAFDRDPSKVKEQNGPTGEVIRGTVGFWSNVPDGEWIPPAAYSDMIQVKIQYVSEKPLPPPFNGTVPEPYTYLNIGYERASGTVALSSNHSGGTASWTVPPSIYQSSGWRLVAVTFHQELAAQLGWGPDDTAVLVWVDGEPLNFSSPFKVTFIGPRPPLDPNGKPPVYDEMQIEIANNDPAGTTFLEGFDDFFVMPDSLSQAQLRSLLLIRRQQQGFYRSARFGFEPARLPAGARISGYAWDGFIPGGSGGELKFRVTAYDDIGTPDPGPEIPYTGTGPQATRFDGLGKPSRKFDWQLDMSSGSVFSPILDEFRVFYTPGRAPRRGAITTR